MVKHLNYYFSRFSSSAEKQKYHKIGFESRTTLIYNSTKRIKLIALSVVVVFFFFLVKH